MYETGRRNQRNNKKMSSIWKKVHNLEDIYWMPSTMSEKNPHPDPSQWKHRTQGIKKIMKSSERYIKEYTAFI